VRDNYFKLHRLQSNVHQYGHGKIEKSLDF